MISIGRIFLKNQYKRFKYLSAVLINHIFYSCLGQYLQPNYFPVSVFPFNCCAALVCNLKYTFHAGNK